MAMNLAAFTLKPPTSVAAAVVGRFSDEANAKGGEEEVATIRGGRYLEVSRLVGVGAQGGGGGGGEAAGVRLEPVLRQDAFSTLRSLCKIRPVGASKDYLVVGSDSGRLCLLELVRYDETTTPPSAADDMEEGEADDDDGSGGGYYYRLRCAAWMPLGPGGCRRAVPGQYVAADPKGRAVFTASLDGHKAAAAVVRNPETGSLELRPAQGFAKASGTATVLSVAALDVGAGGKPAFAVLAGRDQDDIRQAQAAEREAAGLELPDDSLKHVTIYELDLPTNTVATDAKRWRLPASRTGCGLLPVPAAAALGGGGDGGDAESEGEGALLVLSENWVGLKHRTAFKELRAPFPRPKELAPSQGVLPVAWAGVGAADGGDGGFVALVQSEWGDVYKVTASKGPSSSSSSSPSLRVRALPDWLSPCAALAALRGGKLLWAAAEAGDHTLQLRRPLKAGAALGKGREALPTKEAAVGDGSEEAAKVAPVFERVRATGERAALVEVGREGSLAGCVKLVAGPGQGAGRVAALCGRGAASGVRVLEGGLAVVEELEAALPFKVTGVWSLAPARSQGAGTPTYLLLSGAQRTGVLEVGEALVEVEAEARGFVADSRTLEAGAVAQGQGLVQVVPSQLRYVVAGAAGGGGGEKGRGGGGGAKSSSSSSQQPPKVTEWRPPGRREIDRGALSASCVAVAAGGVEVAVFATAALARAAAVGGGGEEVKPQATRDVGVDVSALHILTLPAGVGTSQSSKPQTLVVVGTMDLAVRVLAYEEGGKGGGGGGGGGSLEERFKVTLSHRPESFASLPALSADAVLQLCVGLASGEAQWMAVEVTSASVGGGAAARASLALRLGRSRSVGAGRPVRLVSLRVGGQPAVLALAPGGQGGSTGAAAWLFYPHGRLQGPARLAEHPLTYAPGLEAAAPLALRALPEALVAVTSGSGSGSGSGAGSLRLLWLEQPLDGLGLTEDAFPHALAHTPRAFAPLPRSHVVVVAEGDASASACPPPHRAAASSSSSSSSAKEGGDDDGDEDSHMEVDEDEEVDPAMQGAQAALEGGRAGGLLRVLEPGSGTTRQILPLEEGLMPVAVAAVRFRCAPPNELFVVAAVVPIHPHPQQQPQQAAATAATSGTNNGGGLPPATGYLYTYRCLPSGLQLAHRTPVDEPEVGVPRALCAFAEEGRLLVGFGPATTPSGASVVAAPRVRVYDLGKRRLLRKCDSGPLADDPRLARAGGGIVRLDHRGPWVFATDALKGVQALHYSAQENRLRPVADDPVPRLVSDALVIDRTSVAGADRLGSLFLLRLPWEAALAMDGGEGGEEAGAAGAGAAGPGAGDANPMSRRAFWEACGDVGEGGEGLGAFPSKLEAMAEFHVGEVVTSLARARLGTRGDREALVFATVAGALGTLCPLGTQREREVLSALEAAILKGEPPASSTAGAAASASIKRRKMEKAAPPSAAAAAVGVEGDDATLFPTGRDHLSYRAGPTGSRPARGVIDLDLIAQAGPARRARAARAAKLDPGEAEAVVTEALAAMALSRRSAVVVGGGAGADAGGSTSV